MRPGNGCILVGIAIDRVGIKLERICTQVARNANGVCITDAVIYGAVEVCKGSSTCSEVYAIGQIVKKPIRIGKPRTKDEVGIFTNGPIEAESASHGTYAS